jgi:hypothetical protein
MSSELGQLFQDGLGYSPAVFDAKSIVVHNGSYITAIPQSTQYGAAIALDSSGGLRKDEFYWRTAERDALIPAHWAHRHNSANDWDGGSLREVILANWGDVHDVVMAPTDEVFHDYVGGAGVLDTSGGQCRIRTGSGTTNSFARGRKGGAGMFWSSKMAWRTRARVSDDTSCLVRFGCDMEDIDQNANNNEKIGLEGCDGDGPQYRLVSANGIARHKEPTPFPIEVTSSQGYSLICEPGTTLTIQYSDGTEIAEVNNIPSVGVSLSENSIIMGIKTTNTNEKILTVSAVEYYGKSGVSSWHQPGVTA